MCIICHRDTLEPFLDLGKTALANKFLTQEELSGSEPKYRLRAGFCKTCHHVQLMERIPPKAMFEDYLYISSASDTLKAHLYKLSDAIVNRYHLDEKNRVMDIGCNDGTLLRGFKRHGVRTLGIDPAKNLEELITGSGIAHYTGFFDSKTARQIVSKWGQASVITATNTFPHIQDLQDFLTGIKVSLAPGGTLVMEMHYFVDILDQLAFDTFYHEHISYWSLGPMVELFERMGLEIVDAERLPIHHGQLRVFIQNKGEVSVQPSVKEILKLEHSRALDRYETYKKFSDRVKKIKEDLKRKIKNLKGQGKRIVGYGAPAKGNTLLSFLELGPNTIDYIVDRSSLKQGRYTPGMHIPVVAPERLLLDQPDYVLLLAWNFADEILCQQAEYRKRGGKFIVPLPKFKIL